MTVALLKTGTYNGQAGTVNPAAPDTSYWLYEPRMTYYVLQSEKGGLKVATGHGLPTAEHPESMPVGKRVHAQADQSGRSMGMHTVIGITYVAQDGTVTSVGEVPSKKITHYVFK